MTDHPHNPEPTSTGAEDEIQQAIDRIVPRCGEVDCRTCETRHIKLAELIESRVADRDRRLVQAMEGLKRIGTSTHGNCCTCQECHNYHDECECEHNRAIDAAIALIEKEGTR